MFSPLLLFAHFEPTATAQSLYLYRLAGRSLVSDQPIEILGRAEPVPENLAHSFFSDQRRKILPGEPEDTLEIFCGDGFIAGRERTVLCTSQGDMNWVSIAGIGVFRVDPAGFTQLKRETGDIRELELAVLGPILLMVLALGGVFCLHASGVANLGANGEQEAGILFLGSSGAGKSTLAHHLGAPSWRQFADDLVPIEMRSHGVEALPDLPQPKKPQSRLATRLPIHSFVLLDEANHPHLEPVSPSQAALVLMRHTAASRLFSPSLLKRHLDAATQWAHRTPLRRLFYPRKRDALDPVARLLRGNLH